MNTKLKLNELLKIDGKQLSKYKLHLARYNGEDQPLDIFAQDFNEWITWNTYKYYNNSEGRPYTSCTKKIDGKTYVFDQNGVATLK